MRGRIASQILAALSFQVSLSNRDVYAKLVASERLVRDLNRVIMSSGARFENGGGSITGFEIMSGRLDIKNGFAVDRQRIFGYSDAKNGRIGTRSYNR